MANTNPTKTRRTKGTGGIAHRPDGRWEATLRGQHYYLPTKLDAERKLRDLLNLIDKGVDPAPESLTVGALLTGWLEGHRAAVRPSTFRSHEQVVRLHLLPRLGSVRVNRLQPDDVSGMMTALAAEGKAPGTIRLVRVVLSAALQSAIDAGKLSRNAARIAKAPRVEDSTPFVPTPELARAIIEACGEYSEELRRAVAFGMTTGLRIGEQQGLRWQDADLDGGYLRITHTLTRKLTESGGLAGYVLAPVKTAKSRRRVDLGSSAVAILKAEREAQTDAVGPIPDLVFRTAKGDARTTDPQHLQAALRRAGLLSRADTGTALSWDAVCREGHTSLLIQQGFGLKAISDRLGNSVTVLAKHYAGIVPAEQVKIAAALDSLRIA